MPVIHPQTICRLLLVLLVALPLCAQEETGKRPDLRVPEPRRQRLIPDHFQIAVVDYRDAVEERDFFLLAVPELIRFFDESTDVEIELRWRKLPLYDERIQSALMLYMTGQDASLRIVDAEKEALGRYLREGGFLFAEDIVTGTGSAAPRGGGVAGTPFDRQFKALMRDPKVLGSRGGHWQKIPHDHPLYFNYFDFADGPPLSGTYDGNVFSLEMLEHRGRIAVVFSDLNLSWYWATLDAEGRDRILQLGVNLIVQALTQRFAGLPLPTGR